MAATFLTAGLLVAAVACEGNDPVSAPPGNPGNPDPGDPQIITTQIPEPRACQVRLTELAAYQAVKVLLIVQGQQAPSLNAPLIAGRRSFFRAFLTLAGGAAGNVRANLSFRSGAGAPRVFQQTGLIETESTDFDPEHHV